MGGEEPGLGLEGGGKAIVPDGEIGTVDLCREGELGGDHAIGEGGGEVAILDEAAALRGGGASNDDDFIEVRFGGRFKQKGNIDGEPGIAGRLLLLADRSHKIEPGPADGRVKDGLERLALRWIGKDNGAKG